VVEGSKDAGVTWKPLENGYDIFGVPAWSSAFASLSNGNSGLYITKTIDIRESGDFLADDEILIRFRLFSNSTINGWGWTIDNLFIQDIITDTEKALTTLVDVYPNPFKESITIRLERSGSTQVQLMNLQGQPLCEKNFEQAGTYTIDAKGLADGLYLVRISHGESTLIKKVVKQ
jgi:ABC-type transport system substrate-binding protein